MPVANSHHENFLIVFNPINYEMGVEGVNSDGRIELIPFACHAWIGSYQIK
jgi:hypothetical protein